MLIKANSRLQVEMTRKDYCLESFKTDLNNSVLLLKLRSGSLVHQAIMPVPTSRAACCVCLSQATDTPASAQMVPRL